MSLILLDPVGTSESREREAEIGPSDPPDEESDRVIDSPEEPIRHPKGFSWKKVVHELWPFVCNSKVLAWRFIQLCLRPQHLASIILDFWSLSLSIIWTEKQLGPDLYYPLSSLKKQKSGRLSRLLLEHSRDLQLRNLHIASSPRKGVDPPRVAVIDLDEVPSEIIEREYTVPADFYGFVVMVMFLEILISPILHVFSPIDLSPLREWLGSWITALFGNWIGSWYTFIAGIVLSGAALQWMYGLNAIFLVSLYAVLRGEGTLTLVRRSDVSTSACAVLLDRDFTLILNGPQNVVEAIGESGFSMSHTLARRYQLEGWQFGRWLCYEALQASCQGVPFAILAGFWLTLGPTSLLMAIVPLAPAAVVSLVRAYTYAIHSDLVRTAQDVDPSGPLKALARILLIIIFGVAPTLLLLFIYELAIIKDPVLLSLLQPAKIAFHFVPYVFMIIHFISSQSCRVRTAKLLDIVGPPPVRRWEFDTLAAAATFQCLVLCRGIPRPVRSINVLALLDTFVPDERDVWKVWKARVADRIAHELDISFTPTIPSFGDHRQKHLKELLDQAQIGYGAYTDFYNWHVPLHSTIAL